MKTNNKKQKLQLAIKTQDLFKKTLHEYETNDFHALGDICNSIVVLKEFTFSKATKSTNKAEQEYFNNVFDKHIVLILSYEDKIFSYTRNYIIKFIRGEAKHGDSEVKDQKREALHDFTFENKKKSQFEFFISWQIIAGPNLRSSGGNHDSNGPYLHTVTIGNRRLEVSLLESMTIFIAFEYWQTATGQQPIWTPKTFIKFDPNDYIDLWGKTRVNHLIEQQQYWFSNLENNEK